MKFDKVHIWLLLALIIVLVGFWPSYFAKPFQVSFRHHVHGISASIWFILLIIQPYLYSNKNIQLHRKLGKFSLIVAGAVIASGLLMIPHLFSSSFTLVEVRKIIFFDTLNISGFAVSVLMGVVNYKDVQIHGRWMLTTAFWALKPALARLLGHTFIANGIDLYFDDPSLILIFFTLLLLLIRDYVKENKIYGSYAFLSITYLVMLILNDYIANSSWWASLTDLIFKPASI